MRTYNVHQVVEHVPRVVFADALHALREMLGSAAVQKAEDGVSQRVVHDGIQFAALEIAPTLGVRNFVGRILPHLTDDERIGFLPAGGSVQLPDEAVRQLVGNIQPPAGRAQPQPAADHAVLVLDDVILIAAVALIDLRERVDAPPRAVLVRPVVKVKPAEIRRFLGLERAYAVVVTASVEVTAVVAGVIEHAVQYNAHAASGGFAAQRTEVLLAAEQRVDALVIAGIVAVIGIRLKDWIEINGGNVQALQIIQLGVYAAQRTAEKVVIENFAVLIRQVYRNIVPVLMQHTRDHAFALRLLGRLVAAEAVRKNIVGDALAEPARRVVIAVVYGQLVLITNRLEQLRLTAVAACTVVQTIRQLHREIIPVQTGVRRRIRYRIPVVRALIAAPVQRIGFGLTAVFLNPKGNVQRALCPLRINRKLDRLPCRYRAIRLLACSAAGVKHTIRNAIHASSSKHISSCQIIPYHYISNIGGSIFSIAQNRRTVNKSCRTKEKKTGSIQTF